MIRKDFREIAMSGRMAAASSRSAFDAGRSAGNSVNLSRPVGGAKRQGLLN